MATMNIKDPEVHALARALAGRRGTSMTGAVRQALLEALEREAATRVGMADRILAVAEGARAIDAPFLGDDELYDDDGLPR